MNITTTVRAGKKIAVVGSDGLLITDVQAALDLIATVRYQTDSDRMVLNRNSIADEFFQLSSGLAGEVLQKCVTYRMKLAIVGDFSRVASRSLRDFIYESNHGRDVFFVASEEEAIARLAGV